MNSFARAFRTVLVISVVGGLCVGACLAALVPGAKVIAAAHHFTGDLDEDLGELSQRTTVYDAYGNQIGQLGIENREEVTLDEIPEGLINAVIAIEDRSFYDNPGFDVSGVFRAFVENISSGEIEEGGSTITQQLVKKRILSSEQSVDRKVRELVLAYRLSERYSKNEILEQYLNTVYFGQGSYGVKTAAERFFGMENLADLTVGQSALLAGLIQNPEGDNPFFYRRKAEKRRAEVLRAEVEEGYITQEQADAANAEALPTEVPPAELRPDDIWVDQVQNELLDDPRLGDTRRERRQAVLEGGLQVYTTKDPFMQAQADDAVYGYGLPTANGFTASMVSIDPKTGAVRSMVGGYPDFAAQPLNLATYKYGQQMGSTWKVITLAAALANGYSPNDTVSGSSPCTVGGYGTTSNADGSGSGSLRSMTTGSVNCAFARLSTSVGLDKVIETAYALGISEDRPDVAGIRLDPILTLTLGTIIATPLEMATVAATIANDGVRREPYFVQKVVDADGEVIFDNGSGVDAVQAIPADVAACEMDLLRGPVGPGGTAEGKGVPGHDTGGKTGTTDEQVDAAFLGFTRQLATFVWYGVPETDTPGAGFGGETPATLWNRFMVQAMAPMTPEAFPDPGPVCARPGQQVNEDGGRGGPVEFPDFPDETQPPEDDGGGGGGGNNNPDPTLPSLPTIPTTTTTTPPTTTEP